MIFTWRGVGSPHVCSSDLRSGDTMNVKGNVSIVNNISSIRNCLFRVTGIFLNYYPDLMCHLVVVQQRYAFTSNKKYKSLLPIQICLPVMRTLCSSCHLQSNDILHKNCIFLSIFYSLHSAFLLQEVVIKNNGFVFWHTYSSLI